MLFRLSIIAMMQRAMTTSSSYSTHAKFASSLSLAAAAATAATAVVAIVTSSNRLDGVASTNGHFGTVPHSSWDALISSSMRRDRVAHCQGDVASSQTPSDVMGILGLKDVIQHKRNATMTTNVVVEEKGGGVGREPYGIDVILGSQWGDEGKGKLVDMLSQVSQ
jgi:hypothetical protein